MNLRRFGQLNPRSAFVPTHDPVQQVQYQKSAWDGESEVLRLSARCYENGHVEAEQAQVSTREVVVVMSIRARGYDVFRKSVEV